MKKHNNNNNNNTIDEPQLLWLRHFSAGIFAGGISRTCTAPIDRLLVASPGVGAVGRRPTIGSCCPTIRKKT